MVALKKSKRYWLTKRSDGTTPIHDAAANGHLNKIQRELLTTDTLLTRTANKNQPRSYTTAPSSQQRTLGSNSTRNFKWTQPQSSKNRHTEKITRGLQ